MSFELTPKPDKEAISDEIRPIYELLGVDSPEKMVRRFVEEDQKLTTVGMWDCDDLNLMPNKVKILLEQIDPALLNSEEKAARNEMLWFWNHHAISAALKKNDKVLAKQFAETAQSLQSPENHNKITKLLELLIDDKLDEAIEWSHSINEESEKGSAKEIIEHYKQHGFGS